MVTGAWPHISYCTHLRFQPLIRELRPPTQWTFLGHEYPGAALSGVLGLHPAILLQGGCVGGGRGQNEVEWKVSCSTRLPFFPFTFEKRKLPPTKQQASWQTEQMGMQKAFLGLANRFLASCTVTSFFTFFPSVWSLPLWPHTYTKESTGNSLCTADFPRTSPSPQVLHNRLCKLSRWENSTLFQPVSSGYSTCVEYSLSRTLQTTTCTNPAQSISPNTLTR